MEIKEVTVSELKSLWDSGLYNIEIDTPDGFNNITAWFDKGQLPMVEVMSQSGAKTRCAVNHLLQKQHTGWVPAGNIMPGDVVITKFSDSDVVVSVKETTPEDCYDFTVEHPNHRYWGDDFSSHNSGKSFICAGNLVRHAQQQGIYVILIDTENALDEAWLKALDVDTSADKLLKLNMAMIDDVAKMISEFVKEYKTLPAEERPKVLFVLDSLGMLLTPTDVNQFEAGDLKGDLGRKPKALTALVRNCVNMFGDLNLGLVCTNHTYASQDMFDPDDKISGGQGFIYASSIVVAMRKLKLKEDEDGNKISEVKGIRSACKIMKTRYAKPFESVQVKIPYSTGMSPFSGLVDLFEGKGLLAKDGNSLKYTMSDGTVIKQFRKAWERNENDSLARAMADFEANPHRVESAPTISEETEND
jgi:RecA/RadA recombinase